MEFPHLRSFFECVHSSTKPTADVEFGSISTALCHLGNVAHRTGRRLKFDGQEEQFKNDAEVNALLGREYRSGWELPRM